MNITRWEPFREMEDMLRSYSPFFGRGVTRNGEETQWKPIADITESEQEYLIKAELPEVKKEDVSITLEDNVITISGERKKEKETKKSNEIRIESFYGTFTRSFALPDNADTKAIHAESKDGVLKVHVPKVAAAPKVEAKKIEIK